MKTGCRLKQLRLGRGIKIDHIANYMGITTDHYKELEEDKRVMDINDLEAVKQFYNIEYVSILEDNMDESFLCLYNKAAKIWEYMQGKISKERLKEIPHYLLYFIDMNYHHKYGDMIMGLPYKRGSACRSKKIVFQNYFDYEEGFDTSEVPLYHDEMEIIDGVLDFFEGKSLEEIREFTAKDAPVTTDEEYDYIFYANVYKRKPLDPQDRKAFPMYRLLPDRDY